MRRTPLPPPRFVHPSLDLPIAGAAGGGAASGLPAGGALAMPEARPAEPLLGGVSQPANGDLSSSGHVSSVPGSSREREPRPEGPRRAWATARASIGTDAAAPIGAEATGSIEPSRRRTYDSAGLGLPGAAALPGPHAAIPRLRRLFDPQSGWFRKLERDVSLFLSIHVYTRIPGIDLPYSAHLDRRLSVSEAAIEIARLPESFEGTRVLLLTDIHAGPFLSKRALRRAFDRLAALEPDLILLGGDLALSRVAEIVPHLPAFRSLSAPFGVYAVLGNHDHYTEDPARLRGLLEEHGVRFLHNRSVLLERGGEAIILAGIDDLYRGKPDLDAALSPPPNASSRVRANTDSAARRDEGGLAGDAGGAQTSGSPVILLSHNPDVFFEAARRGVSLVLSGHTHGGQVRVPGLPILVRQSRYRLDEGRYTTSGAELVVSRGLGVSGLPLRVACPPEAVLLELRRG